MTKGYMAFSLSNLATDRNRWYALIVLSLALAIVIIDNTVINVAIPAIIRDLGSSLDAIQWVISGYALVIATFLITVGRLGDMFGQKRLFLVGIVLFALGSLIASYAQTSLVLFLGESVIEGLGAAMMLTCSLSLLVSEFQGRERSVAFGIWGSVAGASATLGPLLGGYLTTYYSWRWSLRINVVVALLTLAGLVFVKESRGEQSQKFDWLGTILSSVGLFSLIFAVIEGHKYGWWRPHEVLTIGSLHWGVQTISIIPLAFFTAAAYLILFFLWEQTIEQNGGSPLLRPSLFHNRGFALGIVTLGIVSLGQFGVFFVLPIYLQNVLGLTALQTGVVFLSTSISVFFAGPLSGIVAAKIGPKWVVSVGMFILLAGLAWLRYSMAVDATGWTLAPGLAVFGVGVGMTAAQLTNVVLSAVSVTAAGEASAVNNTIRQVGTSIGIAIMGVVLTHALTSNIQTTIGQDTRLPEPVRTSVLATYEQSSIESGQTAQRLAGAPPVIAQAITDDIKVSLTAAAKTTLIVALISIALGAISSLFIPNKIEPHELALADKAA